MPSQNGPQSKSALLKRIAALSGNARDCDDCVRANRDEAEKLVRKGRDADLASVAELVEALGVSEGRVYQLTTANYRPNSPKQKALRKRSRASR